MTKHHDPQKEVEILKRELLGLFQHIQRIRKEIASIRKPGAPEDEDHFLQMADELDAIVQATEKATDTIMENVEQMDEVVNAVRPHVSDAEALAALDTFADKTGAIFEACAFQDITGQRITKVVKSLQFIEERVNALISMWGAEEIAEADTLKTKPKDEYQQYLNGPQLSGHGVSQADVDAMFGGPPKPAPAAVPKPAPAAVPKPAPAAVPKPASAAVPKPASAAVPKPAPAAPAAKPAPAPAPKPVAAPAAVKPAPAPAPKPAPKAQPEDEGPKLGQDDIDKLFG